MSFRCKSESLQQQRKFALCAGSFRARTGRDVNNCDPCADFEPLGVERRRLQPEECHHLCRLRGDHRAGQDGRGETGLASAGLVVRGQTKAPHEVLDRAPSRYVVG